MKSRLTGFASTQEQSCWHGATTKPLTIHQRLNTVPSETVHLNHDQLLTDACSHVEETSEVTPSAEGCTECLQMGDDWVHLRICMTCGYVGCCDSSKNKYASKHAHRADHPIVKSFEPGKEWAWCYVDRVSL